ncbi:MAG: tRNA lysidine(34) synthetase TilS [Betaproteobacteria bacterium]
MRGRNTMALASGTPTESIDRAVRCALAGLTATAVAAPARPAPSSSAPVIAVALSGGRDSMVLMDALARLRGILPFTLSAVHVHHGLSPNADQWAEFCAGECEQRAIALAIERVTISRRGGMSREAVAREARYRVLLRVRADAVALAHHADDQAETVLLQLLRGAGPHGLAAMPVRQRNDRPPLLLRPFLHLSAAAIAACASARALRYVEDESNADTAIKRNALRHGIVPALRASFPGYPATLVRAARHQAEAAELLDALARLDADAIASDDAMFGLALDRVAFAALAAAHGARARNLMRWFLRQHDLAPPPSARLDAIMAQCLHARRDSRVAIRHDGAEMGMHRGWVVVHASAVVEAFAVRWKGEPALALPGGTLLFGGTQGQGLALDRVTAMPVWLRSRGGGEHLQLATNRPRQSIASLLQTKGVPWWERSRWPLLWCGGEVAAVPEVGVDIGFQAGPGASGYLLRWVPAVPRRPEPAVPSALD